MTIVCAGLRGEPADDDLLAAGLLAERFVRDGARPGPEALTALDRYERVQGDLAAAFRATTHGGVLVERGFERDLEFCAATDRYGATATLDVSGAEAVLRLDAAAG